MFKRILLILLVVILLISSSSAIKIEKIELENEKIIRDIEKNSVLLT